MEPWSIVLTTIYFFENCILVLVKSRLKKKMLAKQKIIIIRKSIFFVQLQRTALFLVLGHFTHFKAFFFLNLGQI